MISFLLNEWQLTSIPFPRWPLQFQAKHRTLWTINNEKNIEKELY